MVKYSIQSIRIINAYLNWECQTGNINPLINGFSFNVDAGCQYSKFSGQNFKSHIKLWLRKIKYLIQRFQMIAMVKIWTKTKWGMDSSSSDTESTKIVAFAVEPSSILLRREHRSRRLNFQDRIEKISWSWSSLMTSSSSHKSSGQSSQDQLHEFFISS